MNNNSDNKTDMGFKSFIYSFIYLISFIMIFVFGPLAKYGYFLIIIMSLVTILIDIILKIVENKRYKETLNMKLDYDYWRDVKFKDISPVEAGKLLGVEDIGINTFIVILFELEKKGILNIDYVDGKYFINLESTNLDDINNLPYYERSIVKLLFSGINDKSKLEINKVIEMIKNEPEKKVYLDNIYKKIKNNIDIKYYTNYMNRMMENSEKYFINLIFHNNLIMNIFISIMYLCMLVPVGSVLSIPVAILSLIQVLLVIYINNAKYLKEEYVEEVRKLNGLYNYINDFSNIKEKEIKYYELYQEYFLYAVSMGIADKFEIELGYDKLANDIKTNVKFLLECKEEYV